MNDLQIGTVSGTLILAFLCGCAANTQPGRHAEAVQSDCSFRSPTTCWTMSGRYPSTSNAGERPPDSRPAESWETFARAADSVETALNPVAQ
jgi:hypothetical protein